MCEHEKGRVFQRALCLLTASGPLCYEIELAQGTRSDRKDAKDVIPDRLGPRDYAPHPWGAPVAGPTLCVVQKRSRRFCPWRGTLSSSARVPCAL